MLRLIPPPKCPGLSGGLDRAPDHQRQQQQRPVHDGPAAGVRGAVEPVDRQVVGHPTHRPWLRDCESCALCVRLCGLREGGRRGGPRLRADRQVEVAGRWAGGRRWGQGGRVGREHVPCAPCLSPASSPNTTDTPATTPTTMRPSPPPSRPPLPRRCYCGSRTRCASGAASARPCCRTTSTCASASRASRWAARSPSS